MNEVRRLVVVSHVVHYASENRLHAYGAYAREIDLWADLFPEVIIASPVRVGKPPASCVPFRAPNIEVAPIPERGGEDWKAKLSLFLSVPLMTWNLACVLRRADAIHVRCPGNLGLLGAVLAPLFSRFLVAKYAGQWNGFPGEPLTWKAQRWVLRSGWWKGPVTVYGDWPDSPPHVVPFFTTLMSRKELRRAHTIAYRRDQVSEPPLRILFVGRLTPAKNVDAGIQATALLLAQGIPARFCIVGEGPHQETLERMAVDLGVVDAVEFIGAVDHEAVLEWYARSDALVLVSETEGWPKAVVEAMAFGVVCFASNRGLVPWILDESRGVPVPPGDATVLAEKLADLWIHPERYTATRRLASDWAVQFATEDLAGAIADLLEGSWGIQLTSSEFGRDLMRRSGTEID